jgi:stalled ribosome alternative rescue factor ArfA
MAHANRSKVLQVVREDRLFSHKVEKPKAGKGSYSRKGRQEKHW